MSNSPSRDIGPVDGDWLVGQFEVSRPHLRAVAYGMLGSMSEAEDAVQESWLRLSRSDQSAINDLRSWLTTVVGRICLDMLRARRASREDYPGTWLPEPIVRDEPAHSAPADPEQQAVVADSLGIALLVVLETLTPAERLAFVLHDVFAMPYEEIGPVVGRTTEAARQLASRARRRVRQAPHPDGDLARQRRVVDAFLAAARGGDFDALLAVLDPQVTFRVDSGPARKLRLQPLVGADPVARQVLATAPKFLSLCSPVIVNGGPGTLAGPRERPIGVVGFTVVGDQIVAIDVVADPAKLHPMSIKV
jgi:RNA polymerase sigma-70 factor, ECF subfamily